MHFPLHYYLQFFIQLIKQHNAILSGICCDTVHYQLS